MNNLLKDRLFISLALIVTICSGLVCFSVQQSYRSSANDPQIQIAEDIAAALNKGQQMNLPQSTMDIGKSLAPFIMIIEESGKVMYSSALLDGKTPIMPEGIFSSAKENGQHRVTWQPQDGLRFATVIQTFNDLKNARAGFVISGRSLREVDARILNLNIIGFAAWLLAVGSLLVISRFFRKTV